MNSICFEYVLFGLKKTYLLLLGFLCLAKESNIFSDLTDNNIMHLEYIDL